jgi:hypothetical protein
VFGFSLQPFFFSGTFFILRRIRRDIVINALGTSWKVPLLLSDFNETDIFPADFRKKSYRTNLMKNCAVGADLFRADGKTDGQTHDES